MSAIQSLTALLKPVDPLSPEMTISDVADQLLLPDFKAFLSLPVVDKQQRPLGLVSRYRLQDIFMQRFGRDLWGKRSTTEAANPDSLVIPLNTPLDEAARIVTAQLQYPITEDFILVDEAGRYQGLGTALDLLKAMESRIDQRNRALNRALRELKNSQAHLIQSEKMASLGQMVAGVAHELNTPLGYVKNNVQLLRDLVQPLLELAEAQAQLSQCLNDPNTPTDTVEAVFARVQDATELASPATFEEDFTPLVDDTLYGLEQIGELAVSLKDFARLDRAMSEDIDLNECVRSALVIARNSLKDKAQVVTRLSDELPSITCTPSQINQVLLNMLTNAAQAMRGSGQILIKSWADTQRAYISIQDNGQGIPKAIQQRIFDPFFTTKAVGEGTGLGLAISYKIVQQHGGNIRFASEPGRGTRFVISLPLSQPASLQRQPQHRLPLQRSA
tara:strand:- start:59842 stop:61179 length:1338 start_codon:yes stop_codon:yes gene_type:complete